MVDDDDFFKDGGVQDAGLPKKDDMLACFLMAGFAGCLEERGIHCVVTQVATVVVVVVVVVDADAVW
jgi:hypothetical protein